MDFGDYRIYLLELLTRNHAVEYREVEFINRWSSRDRVLRPDRNLTWDLFFLASMESAELRCQPLHALVVFSIV